MTILAAEPNLNALGQFLRVAKLTPLWIERLMAIRTQTVSTFGLKNLGGPSQIDATKPESEYVPGDRVGIFTLISRSANEVLLGDKEKHLNVVVSVHRKAAEDRPTDQFPSCPYALSLKLFWLKHDQLAYGLTRIFKRVCRNWLLHYGRTRQNLPCPVGCTRRIEAAQSAIHWVVDSP